MQLQEILCFSALKNKSRPKQADNTAGLPGTKRVIYRTSEVSAASQPPVPDEITQHTGARFGDDPGPSQLAQWWRICLQCRRHGFHPWVGKIPCRRKWQPTPVFWPGKSHGRRSLGGYGLWSHKESETKQQQGPSGITYMTLSSCCPSSLLAFLHPPLLLAFFLPVLRSSSAEASMLVLAPVEIAWFPPPAAPFWGDAVPVPCNHSTWGQGYGHTSRPACKMSTLRLDASRGRRCGPVPAQPGPPVSDKRMLCRLLWPPVPALPRESWECLLRKRDLLGRSQWHRRVWVWTGLQRDGLRDVRWGQVRRPLRPRCVPQRAPQTGRECRRREGLNTCSLTSLCPGQAGTPPPACGLQELLCCVICTGATCFMLFLQKLWSVLAKSPAVSHPDFLVPRDTHLWGGRQERRGFLIRDEKTKHFFYLLLRVMHVTYHCFLISQFKPDKINI